MTYQFSSEVDRNKLFLVSRSEINGRLDANYYLPKYAKVEQELAKIEYRKLKEFCIKVKKGIFYILASEYVDIGVPFIRISNLKNSTVISDNLTYISPEKHNDHKNTEFNTGDLLLSKTGTLAISTIPKEFPACNISQDIVGVKLKDGMDSEFICIFLNSRVGILQLERIMQGQVQKHLTLGEVLKIKVPLIDVDDQKYIVSMMSVANASKKQKEAEAQRLLDSIDDYLLQELAIELPEDGKNSVQDRMFFRKLSEVSGGRFDPLFHSGGLYGFMGKVRYEMCKFRSVTCYMKSGFAAGKDEQSKDSKDIIQIRPTNITAEGQFVFARNVYIETAELKNHKNDLLEAGEILFNNTNSQEQVGKTVYFDKEENFFCSNHITRIKTVENLDAQYCTSLFNFYKKNKVFFKLCTNWNNQSGIGLDVLAQVYIPLPPIAKQQEIADHIEHIRNKAKDLRKQAAADLEQAKQEVEAMILGGDKK